MNPIKYIKKYLRDRQLNIRRERAIIQGDFVYFIIHEYTNIRKKSDDGKVITYYSRYFAEEECDWTEKVVSASEYTRTFGMSWEW